MSLDLDKRQRAMLREMGIRLWQPPGAASEAAAPPQAAVVRAAAPPPAPTPSAVAAPSGGTAQGAPTAAGSAWSLGAARAVYEPAAGASARWLLLIETATDSAAADPLAGDTGKLLDNMLRAAGLQNSARAAWVPVQRLTTAAGPDNGEPGLAL